MESASEFDTRVVPADSAAFTEAATALGEAYRRGEAVTFLFAGGTHVQHQAALGLLAECVEANVHQFSVPALLKERRMQTQSSIRKAFDAAAEEGALLFFDDVDPLFDWHHPDSLGGAEEPNSVEYFLQRVETYDGALALALAVPEHVTAAQAYGVQLIVEF